MNKMIDTLTPFPRRIFWYIGIIGLVDAQITIREGKTPNNHPVVPPALVYNVVA